MMKIEVVNSQLKGKRIALKDGLSIGTGESCVIRAQHKELREEHARFYETDSGGFGLEVLDDDAHIFVNGRDVLRSELRHNDTVKVGPLRFKIIDEGVKQATELRLNALLESMDEGGGDDEVYDFAKEDLFYITNKDPSLRKAISFSIPSRDRFIDQSQQFLARLVKQSGMDEMKVEAFMTCTKELILNAHRHGHEYDESKTIIIRFRDNGDSITLIIEDQGSGFDHASILDAVRNKSAAEAARERYKAGGFGGLGFQMIVRMADDIHYNDAGNIVTFTVSKDF